MIKYGLISETDARTLEKTIDLICEEFKNQSWMEVAEIGVYGGETGNGIREYIKSKGMQCIIHGIENGKDGEVQRFMYDQTIRGDSSEVYNQLHDNSIQLLFNDGCHCFAHVISDFFCYAPKVKVGGYFAFHDTGKHIKPFKDFQHGDKENPDAYISVRKALNEINLLHDDYVFDEKEMCTIGGGRLPIMLSGWKLIFDEADPNDAAGGICCFRKLY